MHMFWRKEHPWKGLLLNAYGLTVFNRLEKALASPPLLQEGQRPSQFLAGFDMLLVGDASIDDLRQWYVRIRRSLPFDMQLTLANDKSIECAEDLVSTADSLLLARVDSAGQDVSVVWPSGGKGVLCCARYRSNMGRIFFSCPSSKHSKCPMEKVKRVRRALRGDCVSSAFLKSPRSKSFIFINKYKYLLDTGSTYTLIPLQDAKDISVFKTMKLVAANGSLIKTFGKCAVKIRIAGSIYEHIATVADIIHPVLGMDFMVGKGLFVDLDSRKLVHETFPEGKSVNLVSASQSGCEKSDQSLLAKFPTKYFVGSRKYRHRQCSACLS